MQDTTILLIIGNPSSWIFLLTIVALLTVIATQNQNSNSAIYDRLDHWNGLFNIISDCYFVFMIVACVWLVILLIDCFNINYVNFMVQNSWNINNGIMAGESLAIAMILGITSLNKSYYLCFSVKEVLKYKRMRGVLTTLVVLFITHLIYAVVFMGVRTDTVLGLSLLALFQTAVYINIILTVYILLTCVPIMLNDGRFEMSLLNKLYYFFWTPNWEFFDIRESKQWSRKGVKKNFDYLTERYIRLIENKEVKKIKYLKFVDIDEEKDEAEKTKWCLYARDKYRRIIFKICGGLEAVYVLVLLALLIFGRVGLLGMLSAIWKVSMLNVGIAAVTWLISLLPLRYFGKAALKIVADTAGYCAYLENKKEELIPEVALRPNLARDKFIKCMNCINAFFFIWIKYTEKDINKQKKTCEQLMVRIENVKGTSIVAYLPVFTIGYFMYTNSNKVQCNAAKAAYLKILKECGDKSLINKMLESHIRYLMKNMEDNVENTERNVKKYLHWLRKAQ